MSKNLFWILIPVGIIAALGIGFYIDDHNRSMHPEVVPAPEITQTPPDYKSIRDYAFGLDGETDLYCAGDESLWLISDDPQFAGLSAKFTILPDVVLFTNAPTTVIYNFEVKLDSIRIEDVLVYPDNGEALRIVGVDDYGRNIYAQILDKAPYIARAEELRKLAPTLKAKLTAIWTYNEQWKQWEWDHQPLQCSSE